MPRKQSRKKKYLNALLILSVMIAFFIVTFITIIITQGGKFTRNGIVETGSIKVEIQPDRADITTYLDGQEKQLKDGFFTGVNPGEHIVTVKSPKFHSWEGNTMVRAGLVSEITVKLFPLDPELEQITQTQIDKVFFSTNGAYAYYTVTDETLPNSQRGLYSLRVESENLFFRRNQDSEKLASSSDEVLQILENDDLEITPTNDNTKLLITGDSNKEIFVYDFSRTESLNKIINLTDVLDFAPKSLSWINQNNSLLVEDTNILFELNLDTNEKTIISYSKDNSPIYSTNSEITYIYKSDDREIFSYQNKSLTALDIPKRILPLEINSIKVAFDGSALLLRSANDYYYLDIDSLKIEKVISGAKLMDFSFDGTSAIFSKDSTIYAMSADRILAEDDIAVSVKSTKLLIDHNPRFINTTNLLVFNNQESSELQVSDNDGKNTVTVLKNKNIDNGYYAFQPEGTSVTVLLQNDLPNNKLQRNLYKAILLNNSLPFNL